MRPCALPMLIVCAFFGTAASKPLQSIGFTCVASSGAERRINIDLKSKRYHEAGRPSEKIAEINEAAVTLKHYSTITDGFYLDDRLDRGTLILRRAIADADGIVTTEYQCRMGQPFDFAAERKF